MMEDEMGRTRTLAIGVTFVAALVALGVAQSVVEQRANAQAKTTVQAPRFEIDPMWPKPLPNHWLLGSTIGVSVDAQDHVWIIHRSSNTLDNNEKGAELNPPVAECCKGAPPVLAFDQSGNLLASWGGPVRGAAYEWPESNHGITIDGKGNVWIGGNGGNDGQVLKFTKDGKFIKQFGFGYANAGSNDPWAFRQPAKIFVDDARNEAYIADGYGNHRVAVIDAETGAFKRHWGAYGNKPDDANYGRYNPSAPPLQQFRNPVHCAELSKDNFLYVCDRANDRIQVFTPEGTFVKEQMFAPSTLASGSAWDLAFSRDPQQKYLYLADGQNERVYVVERQTLQLLTAFGDGGRLPGQFFGVHSIAVDSKGNVYTTETYEGKRVQRFVNKGVSAVAANQGVAWPNSRR
jgi:DNA-binding beta-propeller fold protein YncE